MLFALNNKEVPHPRKHTRATCIEQHGTPLAKMGIRHFGFGCAVVAICLLLVPSLGIVSSLGSLRIPVPLLSVTLSAVLLSLAAQANDFLISVRGLLLLKLAVLTGALASLGLLALTGSLVWCGALGVAVFTSASILLWGGPLSYYERTDLFLTTAVSFTVAGLLLLIVLSLDTFQGLLVAGATALLSGATACAYRTDATPQREKVSRAVSRARGIAGRGNRFTVFSIGMMVGAVIVMGFSLPFAPFIKALLAGGTMIVSGLATIALRARFKQAFEHLARRTIAVATTLALLPYPFVPPWVQALCTCILLVSATLNCIVLIDAIAETAHLKQISPYWLIGKEGPFFMMGALITLAAFCASTLGRAAPLANTAGSTGAVTVGVVVAGVCAGFAIAFAALQVLVEEQTYPFFEMEAEDDAEEQFNQTLRQDGLFAGGGVRWRERLDEVSAAYKLSPRQQEVMKLLLKGRDVKYIMNRFVISQATAKTHVYNLYKKLGVHSRRELMDLIEQGE